jgi:hypothetical protein
LFDEVVAAVWKIGPVRIVPEKTRIAFQVRTSFAQVTPKLKWLDSHVVLARRFEHPRFRQVQTISPRNHVHTFRLTSLDDIDAEVNRGSRKHIPLASNVILTKGVARRDSFFDGPRPILRSRRHSL